MSNKNLFPIFIICGKSPTQGFGGGYSTYARNLALLLKKLKLNVYIIALGNKNSVELTECGTLIHTKFSFGKAQISALPSLPIISIIFANTIHNEVKKQNYSKAIIWGIGPWGLACTYLKFLFPNRYIHVNNYFTTTNHELKGALKAVFTNDYNYFLRIKYYLGYYIVGSYLSIFDRLVAKSSDYLITNYKSTEEILKKEFSIQDSKFYRMPFPISIYERKSKIESNLQIKLPKKYVLYISRHDARKGINYLLHASAIIKQMGLSIPIVIAGVGELFNANLALAKKLKLEDTVIFKGFVPSPRQIMQRATMLCFPTLEEGAGALIINEAMSIKLPIVSTACDGIVEDVYHNKSALLVPAGDSLALAKAIIMLWNDAALRKRLAINAFNDFKKMTNKSSIDIKMRNLIFSINKPISLAHFR